MVVGEPHFISSLLPWQSVYFWYQANELSQCVSSSATILPQGATVWAMAVQFDHLWKIRAPLHSVEGFQMTDFDKLIEVRKLSSYYKLKNLMYINIVTQGQFFDKKKA